VGCGREDNHHLLTPTKIIKTKASSWISFQDREKKREERRHKYAAEAAPLLFLLFSFTGTVTGGKES